MTNDEILKTLVEVETLLDSVGQLAVSTPNLREARRRLHSVIQELFNQRASA